MPEYGYSCKKHGEFAIWQSMNECHTANCPKCGKPAVRIFYAASLHGDLPYKNSTHHFGKTRDEMFKNFETEGIAPKDMQKYDKHKRETNLIEAQERK